MGQIDDAREGLVCIMRELGAERWREEIREGYVISVKITGRRSVETIWCEREQVRGRGTAKPLAQTPLGSRWKPEDLTKLRIPIIGPKFLNGTTW